MILSHNLQTSKSIIYMYNVHILQTMLYNFLHIQVVKRLFDFIFFNIDFPGHDLNNKMKGKI